MEVHSPGRRATARAIGWLIGVGAAIVLIRLALPHPDRIAEAPLVCLVVATWALAAALLAGRFDGASRRALLGVEALAALLISAALVALDDPTSGFALSYACLTPYAFATGPVRRGWLL